MLVRNVHNMMFIKITCFHIQRFVITPELNGLFHTYPFQKFVKICLTFLCELANTQTDELAKAET